MYEARYAEVLPYHRPGLAPVRDETGAFHIRPDGQPAYEPRHLRTFGYYEGLAAVRDETGWHHIDARGVASYSARFDWCGNVQEGRCPVRLDGGLYVHIDATGKAAYGARYRYAGDFRKGAAVVQRDDGLHGHIDLVGRLVHEQWYVDLDVFHKGYARARDGAGWMHVGRGGLPAYGRRFAMFEPFYNGQARVERFDGALEVIDEGGSCLAVLREPRRSGFASLSGDIVGYWRTQAIHTAVLLGVPDAVPGTAVRIAERCGLDPERTERLMRGLGEIGLADRSGEGWRLTEKGKYLRRDDPLTLADAAIEFGGRLGRRWGTLPDAIRDGRAWSRGDVFEEVAAEPGAIVGHSRMLNSYAEHDYPLVPEALGLRGDETLVDAGGGLGFLARHLLMQYPGLRVVLLDRPEVIRLGEQEGLEEERLELRATDLFEPWSVTADVVLLARVLHDWDDDRALTVLANARAALPPSGRVFIIEMLLPENSNSGGLCDLHLLMASGGRERTAEQFGRLLEAAGFEKTAVREIAALPSIVEGVAQ